MKATVRIGGASGFWGDSAVAAPQLVRRGEVNYLVFDYLAELTMSILVAQRAKDPGLGYATDFVDVAMKSVLAEVAAKGIRVVANAGGVNPRACAAALARLAESAGVKLGIAVVEGDDVMPLLPQLREQGVREMFSGAPLPERVASATAYLGAIPIARALAAGADVVVTGRCVDSALVLGPLMHEFGWAADDYDRLAAASLAGHIVECGCQATGGLFTDWESVPGWEDMGYPVLECASDGSFVVTKPAGTGGLVSVPAVAEQMLYEIGDPASYVLPDVICDFSEVRLEQAGPERVRVTGARGFAPTDRYKVSATWVDGFRAAGSLTIIGIDAARKARRTGEAILARTRGIFRHLGLPDYARARVEVLGAEDIYGPHARAGATREAVLRVAVHHPVKQALEIFAREIAPAGTSWSPGTTGAGGRPGVSPLVRLFSFTVPKSALAPTVTVGGETHAVAIPPGRADAGSGRRPSPPGPAAPPEGTTVEVPLVALAHGRSGDKGDSVNIGVIAREARFLPLLRAQLTPEAVKAWFAHLVRGDVVCYEVPGIGALNFVLHEALDGGGMASLRNDPLGKGFAQMLLDMPVKVPAALARELGGTRLA
ncbi:MAG: DUF1446 domain-containing protein [Burkholderiales bacterium]|nr:DUF1446 domain-containing protein [Burkholderiales bacterium]